MNRHSLPFAAMTIWVSALNAQGLEEHVDAVLAPQAAIVEQQKAVALDKSASADDRVDAFMALRAASLDAAVLTARAILNQRKAAPELLANEAADALAAAAFPTHYAYDGHHGAHASHGANKAVLDALRVGLNSPYSEVQRVVAGPLARARDTAAIGTMVKALNSSKPRLEPSIAAQALAIAGPAGHVQLVSALRSGGRQSRVVAANVLGPSPEGRDILKQVLVDSAEPTELRVAAAQSLAQHDPSFGGYAGFVLLQSAPEPLKGAVIAGLREQLEQGRADASLPWRGIVRTIGAEAETKSWAAYSRDAARSLESLDLDRLGYLREHQM